MSFPVPNKSPGYKLWTQIARALQSRSQTIKTALEKYNSLASALNPPAPRLSWEQVVNYGFLSEFDLLRDVREDVRQKAWASPANRTLRDNYFKMKRAHEEIERLNIEIHRVITYMTDETNFLIAMEATLTQDRPQLAHQVALYHMERGRAFSVHRTHFAKLFVHPRFNGTATPGQSIHLPPASLQPTKDRSSPYDEDAIDPDAYEESLEREDDVDDADDADDIAYKFLLIALGDGLQLAEWQWGDHRLWNAEDFHHSHWAHNSFSYY